MSRSLGVILGISLLLGLGYAALMPLGAAPDEGAHLQYVRVVAYEARLPQLKLEQRRQSHADPDYESHQAPLYYVLAVPFFRVGEMVAGEAGAGQACRLLSLLFGLVGTALIWRLARDVLPACPEAALAAAALAGFLPMRLYLMASVSNDTLAEAASSLALWCMVRAVQAEWGWKPALRLGISLGVALLAKQNTFLLFPPALVAVYLAARRGSRAAPAAPENGYPLLYFLGTGGITLGTALLLSGWWFFRNHVLYGDPLGLRVFNWYFADTPLWLDFRDQGFSFPRYLTEKVFPTAFATFWGAFGHLDPSHPEWFMGWYRRPELSPFAAALATPLEWVWPFRSYPPRSWVYPLLALATGASAAGWVRIYLRWKQAGATGAAAATRPAPRAESSPPARGGRKRRASQPATAPVRPLDPPVAGPDSAAAAGAGILALHWVFVAAAFLNFNATYFQAQGRYLFPALAATTLALVRGWGEWTGSRPTILVGGVGGGLLLLALYALFGVIGPGF